MISALQLYQAEHSPRGNYGYLDTTRIRADAGSQFISHAFADYCIEQGINLVLAAPRKQIKTIWPNAPGRRSPARLALYWFTPIYRIRFGITPLLIVLTSSMFCLCGAFAVTILTFQLPPTNSFSVRNHESAIFVPSDALLSYVNGRVQIIPMVNKPSAGSEASSLG
jgi:hypothetical protein